MKIILWNKLGEVKVIRRMLYLCIILIIISLFITACKKNDDGVFRDSETENEDSDDSWEITRQPEDEEDNNEAEKQDNDTSKNSSDKEINKGSDAIAKEVYNNGGNYVEYQGNVYYRQYTADNYETTGVLGGYNTIHGISTNIMQIQKDGTIEIAFPDTGEGKIYISNDRMYLEKFNKGYEQMIYSVNLDGSNEQELGEGWILGIDEKSGTLVCFLKDNNTYQLSTIDGSNGETKYLKLNTPIVNFLGLNNGVIYYYGGLEYGTPKINELIICSVNIDGSNEKLLVNETLELYEYENDYFDIPCLQFVGDTIYFSYGIYAGSGHFYQGGHIAKVNKDGSDYTLLLGVSEDGKASYDHMVDDIFYVTKEKDDEILFYTQIEGQEKYALNLRTNVIEETSFIIHPEGVPFEYDGGIYIYNNAEMNMTKLIPAVDYSHLDLDKALDYHYTIKNIELCDGWVYYKLEANEYDPEVSIGWRDGYRRIKSTVLRQEPGGDKIEVLYNY